MSSKTVPNPRQGGPYRGGQQGKDPDCASHAVGGCVEEIIDSFDLDCDHRKIYEDLREKKQSNGEPLYISEFQKVILKVDVFEEVTSEKKLQGSELPTKETHSVEIELIVQPADHVGYRVKNKTKSL